MDQPIDASVPPTASDQTLWDDLLNRWQSGVNDFQASLAQLQQDQSIAAADPGLLAEYNSVLSQAANVQAAVIGTVGPALADVVQWLDGVEQSVAGAWQSVSSTVSGWLGLSGFTDGSVGPLNLRGLGIVWLIPAAVVAAAIAAVAVVANNAYGLHARLTQFNQLTTSGTPPAQAADLVGKAAGDEGGVFGNVAASVKWIVVLGVLGVGAYWLWQQHQRRRQRDE